MNNEFIDDFIQEYKNQTCLWQTKSEHFKNRKKRQEAYMKLIEVANKHGEHYNIEKTKQKINNLRCAFRVQLKKVAEVKNKGGKEEPYCPKRRYFESLLFLMEEEKPGSSLQTVAINCGGTSMLPVTNKITDKLKGVTVTKISSQSNMLKKEFPKKGSIIVKPSLRADISIESNTEDEAELLHTKVEDDEGAVSVELESYTLDADEELITDELKEEEYQDEHVPKSEPNDGLGEVIIWPNEIKQSSNTPAITSIIKIPSSGIIEQPLSHHQNQHLINRQRTPSLSSSISSTTGLFKEDHPNLLTQCQQPNKKIKIDFSPLDFEKLLAMATTKAKSQEADDNYTIFGKMVAYKLRSMDSQQSVIAEKIIHDILLEGQMKLLTYPTTSVARHNNTGQHTYVFSTSDLNGTTSNTTSELVATSAVPSNTSHQATYSTIHYTTANNNGSQQLQ